MEDSGDPRPGAFCERGRSMKERQASFLGGTLLLTGTGLLGQVLGFLYRIFLSRLVGAEVMGLYQLVLPVQSVLLSVTAIGLTAAVSNLSSEYRALGQEGIMGAVLRRCLAVFIGLFVVAAVVVGLGSDAISVYLLGDARTRLALLVLLPCLLLTGVENLHKHYFYGGGTVGLPAAVEVLEQFIRTGAVLGLLVLFLPQNEERTVGLIALGMTICEVFSACTLVLSYRRRTAAIPRVSAPPGLGRRIASIALPVGATAVLGNLMGAATAVLVPQRLVAGGVDVSDAMASFGILCGMTLPMLAMPTAFIGAMALVLVPRLARETALGRQKQVHGLIHRALLSTSVLILPAMSLLVVVGPTLGRLLYREERAGDFLLPLSIAMAFSCYQAVLSGVLNGVGQQRFSARNALISGGVQTLGTFWLMSLPGWGLKGYVASCLLSAAVGAGLNWVRVQRSLKMKPRLFQWCAAPGLAALLTGLCARLLFRVLLDAGFSPPLSVLFTLLFGVVLYLAALFAQGVGRSSFSDD